MVEFEEYPDKKYCICRSPKMKTEIYIKKDNSGFIFYEISLEKGVLPADLSGKYSSMKKAKAAVTAFLNNRKETFAAKSEFLAQEREKRKAKDVSVVHSEEHQHIREGSDH